MERGLCLQQARANGLASCELEASNEEKKYEDDRHLGFHCELWGFVSNPDTSGDGGLKQ